LQADAGASVICGLQEGVGARKFRRYLDGGQVEKILRYFPARAGESFFIPSGRVHTVGPSCVIVEVQQNSDITYRVYDWGRLGVDGRPRRLHVEEACSVIDFADAEAPVLDPVWERKGDVKESILVACPEFTVERFDLEGDYADECRGRHFQVLTGIEGEADLEADCAPGLSRKLEPGSFLLLPAYLGAYRIRPAGKFSFLKSYVT
ncbi:MAG TPA: hypothetical protein PK636_05080, partial [bacterium]|nr:hypothetical protein [bacterium]